MPWKNGKGTTSEILIHPDNSSLSKLDFHYRLSSSPINEKSIFSKFPGYDRILIPIQGIGFSINGAEYTRNEIAFFSGDIEAQCELLDKAVIDLGLIYDPKLFMANVKIITIKSDLNINIDKTTSYLIFIQTGTLNINDIPISEGECLLVTEELNIKFTTIKSTSFIMFKLQPV